MIFESEKPDPSGGTKTEGCAFSTNVGKIRTLEVVIKALNLTVDDILSVVISGKLK